MAATEPVVVVRPPGRDPFGDPLPGGEQRYVVPGCRFAPGPSRELAAPSHAVQSDGTVYATKGTGPVPGGVRNSDLVEVRGVRFTVLGDPQDWGRSGVVIVLRRYTG